MDPFATDLCSCGLAALYRQAQTPRLLAAFGQAAPSPVPSGSFSLPGTDGGQGLQASFGPAAGQTADAALSPVVKAALVASGAVVVTGGTLYLLTLRR